jgi:hypothetical protein
VHAVTLAMQRLGFAFLLVRISAMVTADFGNVTGLSGRC